MYSRPTTASAGSCRGHGLRGGMPSHCPQTHCPIQSGGGQNWSRGAVLPPLPEHARRSPATARPAHGLQSEWEGRRAKGRKGEGRERGKGRKLDPLSLPTHRSLSWWTLPSENFGDLLVPPSKQSETSVEYGRRTTPGPKTVVCVGLQEGIQDGSTSQVSITTPPRPQKRYNRKPSLIAIKLTTPQPW